MHWTLEEQELLKKLVKSYGKDPASFVGYFPNRTECAIQARIQMLTANYKTGVWDKEEEGELVEFIFDSCMKNIGFLDRSSVNRCIPDVKKKINQIKRKVKINLGLTNNTKNNSPKPLKKHDQNIPLAKTLPKSEITPKIKREVKSISKALKPVQTPLPVLPKSEIPIISIPPSPPQSPNPSLPPPTWTPQSTQKLLEVSQIFKTDYSTIKTFFPGFSIKKLKSKLSELHHLQQKEADLYTQKLGQVQKAKEGTIWEGNSSGSEEEGGVQEVDEVLLGAMGRIGKDE